MKRIWFTQQKPFDYLPLRWGLGNIEVSEPDKEKYCPKCYTTRTHRLKGQYYVVEGNRFKAVPVIPRIEFRVTKSYLLNLKSAEFKGLEKNGYCFAELDLGIKGATFEQLRAELLRLNPKANIDTPFYVSELPPLKNGGFLLH